MGDIIIVKNAIHWTFGIEVKDDEERIVDLMSTWLMRLQRDNPCLARWIATTLESRI